MSNLGTPEKTLEIIGKYGFHFQKKYGQNFLIEKNIIENIISSSGIDKDDCVLEIGPGIGTMTEYLCKNSKFVIAVEIDKNLIPILEETLKDYDNKIIINQDILKTDISDLSLKYNNGKPIKVVANLPYYITTPIIMGLFEKNVPLKSITVMIQKEVALKFSAKSKDKEFSALSILASLQGRCELLFDVDAKLFNPPPKVTSSVIKLQKTKKIFGKDGIFEDAKQYEAFKVFLRAAFASPRKTLLKNLSTNFDKKALEEIFEDLSLAQNLRPHELDVDSYLKVFERLKEDNERQKRRESCN